MTYKTLPPGYRWAGTMDFMRNRGQMLAVVKLALALTVAPLAVGFVIVPPGVSWALMKRGVLPWLAMFGMLIGYIPLHELTHGAAMFALSGVKPTYGLKLPYAYAGSTAWFDRRSHILTALAPIALWGVALGIALWRAPREWFWPLWLVQISNLSGSAGDLYCAWFLWRMPGELLIQDTGVRMRIMRKADIPPTPPPTPPPTHDLPRRSADR